MNASQVLKMMIVRNALFYGETLPNEVIVMHAEALADLPVEAVAEAYRRLQRSAKVRRMPMPGEVRDLVTPQADRDRDDADAAREVAGRILTAISRFGYTNAPGAREFIGELGWAVVERQGGWASLCRTVTPESASIYQSQWRELAAAVSRRSRMGIANEAPALPGRALPAVTRLAIEATKEIPQ